MELKAINQAIRILIRDHASLSEECFKSEMTRLLKLKDEVPITEHPAVQKVISENITLTAERDRLREALKINYEFTKYAGANKKTNTDEYLKEFFEKGEQAQKEAKQALSGKGE